MSCGGSGETIDYGEDDFLSLERLFVCEKYTEKTFNFDTGTAICLLCSNMSSTDHDLTGQIVWPASIALSWFIAMNRETLFRDKRVLELGAGCGLAGFLASQTSSRTMITDGNDVVLRLLDKNRKHLIESQGLQEEACKVRKLIWGSALSIQEAYSDCEDEVPDVIIGADVILWPNYIPPLLQSLYMLLSMNPVGAVCYISYVVRATSVTERLLYVATELGLSVVEIDTSTFIPEDVPTSLLDVQKRLFKITMSNPETIQPCRLSELGQLALPIDHDISGLENFFSPY